MNDCTYQIYSETIVLPFECYQLLKVLTLEHVDFVGASTETHKESVILLHGCFFLSSFFIELFAEMLTKSWQKIHSVLDLVKLPRLLIFVIV